MILCARSLCLPLRRRSASATQNAMGPFNPKDQMQVLIKFIQFSYLLNFFRLSSRMRKFWYYVKKEFLKFYKIFKFSDTLSEKR